MASAGGLSAEANDAVKSTATPQVKGAVENTASAAKEGPQASARVMAEKTQGLDTKSLSTGGLGGGAGESAKTAAEVAANPAAGTAKVAAKAAGKTVKNGAKKVSELLTGDGIESAGGLSEGLESADPKLEMPNLKGAAKHAKRGAAATSVAAPAAGQAAMIWMLLNYLKYLFQTLLSIISNILSAIWGAITAAFQAVVGFFMAAGSMIASLVGGAFSIAAGAVMSFVSTVVTVVAVTSAVISGVTAGDIAKHDDVVRSCSADVKQTTAASITGIDQNATTVANAQHIYGVLSAWGMSDINIAAVLGNWQAESGIDPTGVETIYTEPFTIGPRKLSAEKANFKASVVASSYSAKYPAIDLLGIGLGQWTNGRNTMLRNYANGIKKPWQDIDTQLGFMVSKDDATRVKQIQTMISNENSGADSIDEATAWFKNKWEGLTNNDTLQKRREAASALYAQMKGWAKNETLAHSILAQSNASLTAASDQAVRRELAACIGSKLKVDNSSLATAATSYAWPMYDDSKGNDGTDLYYWLHSEIFPSDTFFASCDRSVATGVRWSGSDDTYPRGSVGEQIKYLSTSDKWQQVDWKGDKANLQPGDILLRKSGGVSHTVMYVGPDIPLKIWGEGKFTPGAEIVSGSLNDRSPALGQWYGASSGHGTSSTGGSGLNTYLAFRLKKPEASSQYSSLTPPASARAGEGNRSRHGTPGGGFIQLSLLFDMLY